MSPKGVFASHIALKLYSPLMLRELQEQSRWLSRYAFNVTSQRGEDGIIAKALSLLPERSLWCVEFGAWDGKLYSNTYDLISSHNYRGVFIEADPVRFRDLELTHGASGKNVLLNAFVGFSKVDCLDVLLSRCEIPKKFDLLSIDIDGNDYYVWEALEEYRPNLVMIEFNPTFSNSVLFVQKKDHETRQGSSPASLVELAQRKGYELIAATFLNLLFVSAEHYGAFGVADNSLALMRDDSDIPHIFVGYDGHVFLSQGNLLGSITLPWHKLRLKESDIQVLPERLQKYPDQYTRTQKFLYYLKFGLQNPRRVLRRLQKAPCQEGFSDLETGKNDTGKGKPNDRSDSV
jgi:hypothetical protein